MEEILSNKILSNIFNVLNNINQNINNNIKSFSTSDINLSNNDSGINNNANIASVVLAKQESSGNMWNDMINNNMINNNDNVGLDKQESSGKKNKIMGKVLNWGKDSVNNISKIFGDGSEEIIGNINKIMGEGLDKFKNWGGVGAKVILKLFELVYKYYKAAFDMFKKINEKITKFSKDSGILRSELMGVRDDLFDVQSNLALSGADSEDFVNSVGKLNEEYGTLIGYSKDLVVSMSKYSGDLGISIENSAKLVKRMDMLGLSTDASKQNMMDSTVELAKQENIAPNKIFEKMANASSTFYKYISGSPQKLAEMAVYATKLNTSFDELASVADGLLDIESSIQKVMQANVISGKNMNLHKAREYAIMGDMKSMSEEILNQAGSLEEFNQMNMYAKKNIAEAMGMEVSKLREQLMLREKMAAQENDPIYQAGESVRDLWEKLQGIISGISKSMFEPAIKFFGNLAKQIEPYFEEGSIFMESVHKTVDVIKDVFSQAFEMIWPKGNENGLKKFFEETMPKILKVIQVSTAIFAGLIVVITKIVQIVVKIVWPVLKQITNIIVLISKLFYSVGKFLVNNIAAVADFWKNIFNAFKDFVTGKIGLKEFFSDIYNSVKTLFSDIFDNFRIYFKEFFSTIDVFLKNSMDNAFELLTGWIEPLFKPLYDNIMKIVNSLKDKINNIRSSLIESIPTFVKGLWNGIIQIYSHIENIFVKIGNIIFDVITFIPKLLWDGIKNLGSFLIDSISTFWNDFKDKIVSIGKTLKETFVNAWDSIKVFFQNIPIKIANTFKTAINKIIDIMPVKVRSILGIEKLELAELKTVGNNLDDMNPNNNIVNNSSNEKINNIKDENIYNSNTLETEVQNLNNNISNKYEQYQNEITNNKINNTKTNNELINDNKEMVKAMKELIDVTKKKNTNIKIDSYKLNKAMASNSPTTALG